MAFHEHLSPESVEGYISCAAGYFNDPQPKNCKDCACRKYVASEVARSAFEHSVHFDDMEEHYATVMSECTGATYEDTVCVGGELDNPVEKKQHLVCGMPEKSPARIISRIVELAGIDSNTESL